jgi:hypothetical protein
MMPCFSLSLVLLILGSWTQELLSIPSQSVRFSKTMLLEVYLANGSALDIVGMDDIRIKVNNDLVWKLHKIRHAPELKDNLISE